MLGPRRQWPRQTSSTTRTRSCSPRVSIVSDRRAASASEPRLITAGRAAADDHGQPCRGGSRAQSVASPSLRARAGRLGRRRAAPAPGARAGRRDGVRLLGDEQQQLAIAGAAELQQRLRTPRSARSDRRRTAGSARYIVRKSRSAGMASSAPVGGQRRAISAAACGGVSGSRRCATQLRRDRRGRPFPARRRRGPATRPAAPSARRRSRRGGATRPPACSRRLRVAPRRPAPRPPSAIRQRRQPLPCPGSPAAWRHLAARLPAELLDRECLQVGEPHVGVGDDRRQRRHSASGAAAPASSAPAASAQTPPRRRPRRAPPRRAGAPVAAARPSRVSRAPMSPSASRTAIARPVSVEATTSIGWL